MRPKWLADISRSSSHIFIMVRPTIPRRISSLSRKAQDVNKRDVGLVGIGIIVGMVLVSVFSASSGPTNSHTNGGAVRALSNQCPETASSLALPAGVRPIYVHTGNFDLLSDAIPTKWWLATSPAHSANVHGEWFAQHGQDVAVAKFHNFKQNGFFVDLAANDAVWASNTFSLEQNFGWKGICIEANNYYWFRLGFRKCHTVGAIVGGTDGDSVEVSLGQGKAHGPYGGIVGDDFDNKKKKKTQEEPEKRYTLSLATILKTFDAPSVIDYLSLDVEGAESFILKEFPFDKYTFKTMTIERPKDDLRKLFEKHGYKHVLDFRRGDTLWAHKSVYAQGQPLTEIAPDDIDHHLVSGSMPGITTTA